jgi:hypothetical protein
LLKKIIKMNVTPIIDKLKLKVKESDEYVKNTYSLQISLINDVQDFNDKIKNYIKSDVNEKNSYNEAQDKLMIVKTRVEVCKQNINNIKVKLHAIKDKYNIN